MGEGVGRVRGNGRARIGSEVGRGHTDDMRERKGEDDIVEESEFVQTRLLFRFGSRSLTPVSVRHVTMT